MADFDFASGDEQKPRTSCTSLTHDILTQMHKSIQEPPDDLLFRPPCGFKLEGRDSNPAAHLRLRQKVRVTIADRISAIDVQMAQLQRQKDMLVNKRQDMDMADESLELQATRERGRHFKEGEREGAEVLTKFNANG